MNPFRKPDSIRPGEQVIACPACGQQRPMMPMDPLVNFVMRNGLPWAIKTGHQVACVDCGCLFFVGPQGAWKPRAQPKPARPPEPERNGDDERSDPYDDSGLLAKPLAPPRV